MLKLYTYFRSSASFRVRIAMCHKGLEWDPTVIWLLDNEQSSPMFKQVNPQGLVPVLVDGDHTLVQSMAIIEYLDETRPGPKLLPSDPLGRARVRALSQAIACEIHPLNNPRVLKYLKTEFGQAQPAIDTWYRHWCDDGFAAFEAMLSDGKSGLYCHGDTVTMADTCLVPQVFNARRFAVNMSAYPVTMAIFDRLMKLDAVQRAQPDAQPEAARAAAPAPK